uniref:Sec2p domain-containing protein n=1 Tax=Haemonchus contortus TaxID=6289 RepID=A0A7I4XUD0_HAECO
MPSVNENENMEYLRKGRTAIEATRAKVQALKECVNESVEKLNIAFETLAEEQKEAELQYFEDQLQVAGENTNQADQFCANLTGRRAEIEQLMADLQPGRNEERSNVQERSYHSTPAVPALTPLIPTYLPRLEIPKFAGRKAGWDNF